MLNKKSFTLIEILVVIIVIGILASVALPVYTTTKERMLDSEAKTNIALIQVAEKIRKMETGAYYPVSGTTNVVANINSALKVSLFTGSLSWTYTVDGDLDQVTAARLPSSSRVWTLTFIGIAPACTGTGCP